MNVFSEYQQYVKYNLKNLRYSITHSDPNNYNLVVKNNKISGLLDYGDSIYAPVINDLSICLSYALMNNKTYKSAITAKKKYYNSHLSTKEDQQRFMHRRTCGLCVLDLSFEIGQIYNNVYISFDRPGGRAVWSGLCT